MEKTLLQGYFLSRWNRLVPTSTLFWRDMLLIGTLINLAVGFVALLLLAKGVPSAVAATVFFSTLPYNLFLLIAFWRSGQRTGPATVVALIWFVFVTCI